MDPGLGEHVQHEGLANVSFQPDTKVAQTSNFEEIDIQNSLPYHPLSYLIPSQLITPLILPYNPEIQTDKILFSQDDVNDKVAEETLLNSEIWKSEDPDLQFVKFKKPCTNLHFQTKEMSTTRLKFSLSEMNPNLLSNITPVKRTDYLKYGVKPETVDLGDMKNNCSDDDDQILNDVINMLDSQIEVSLDNNADSDDKMVKNVLEPMKPEFLYNSTVTQSELLMCVMKSFVKLVTQTRKPYLAAGGELVDVETGNNDDDSEDGSDEDEDEVWNHYTRIFPEETQLVSPETLITIKANLGELTKHSLTQNVNPKVYSWLLDSCIGIIKESFPIDWEDAFNSGYIYDTNEYQSFLETVIQSCSIVLILYSNGLVDKIGKHEKGLSIITDFILTFAGVCKRLFKTESFSELPDFFIPMLKSYMGMINTLSVNLGTLLFNESLITRLEYISFDIIFADMVYTKERFNINVVLEELRAEFVEFLIGTYQNYEDQRSFLFNEIIENFSTLNPLKSRFKNYRLRNGISVQLVSYMIVSFIQCHTSYGNNFDFSKWEFLSISHSSKATNLELKEMNDCYWKSVEGQYQAMIRATDNFVSTFLNKVITTYTPSLRKIIENFIADFLAMVELPELASCSVLLNSMLSYSIHACKSSVASLTSAHALLFEIIGTIGSKLLQIKGDRELTELTDDTDVTSFKALRDHYYKVLYLLKYGKLKNDETYMHKYMCMLWLVKLKRLATNLSDLIAAKNSDLVGDHLRARKALLEEVKRALEYTICFDFSEKSELELDLLSQESVSKHYTFVLLSTQLFARYNDILAFIMMSLNNPKVKSRTLAIKNLTLLINKEPEILHDARIRKMIKRRLCETSTSVVDSSIDLLLKVLEGNSAYVSEYYEIMTQKLADSSFLVRKKSIGVIKFMYENTDQVGIKSTLCRALLLQLDDEDDRIVDAVCCCLTEILFLGTGHYLTNQIQADPIIVQNKAEDIISVLCGVFAAGTETWEHFERFLSEWIVYKCDFNRTFKVELEATLELLVDTMLALVTDTKDNDNDGKIITAETTMGILSAFVKCDETIMSQDQLVTIQPYIINDYQSSQVCFYALNILNLALNHYQTLNKNFIASCKSSLMKRLTKLNSKELDCAIQCIWKLFKIEGDTSGVSKACVSSLKLLLVHITKMDASPGYAKLDPAIMRLLYLIGNFGRYCNFQQDRDIFIQAKVGLQENEAISVLLLKYVLKFCDSSTPKPLRKVAIKNALNVCISHPKLFFSVPISTLIESAFRKKDMSITDIVIGSLLTLLENEELKMMKKNGLDVKRSGSIKLDLAVFHGISKDYVNDGICSTLVQKYLRDILDTCLDANNENSINSIEFLRMTIKFGFSNPKTCFPTVVALECSKSKYIKHVALQLHRFLFEKFETLIESTYSEAIKKAITYVSAVYAVEDLGDCKSFLRSFYRIVNERNSKQRSEKFILSIVRTIGSISMHKLQRMNEDELNFIQVQMIFLSVNINEVEFTSQLDALTIINLIEKIILSEGPNFMNNQVDAVAEIFADDEDDNSKEERLKRVTMGKILLSLNCLLKCLTTRYSITAETLLKFQESSNKKEFRIGCILGEHTTFFSGDIKNMLTTKSADILTALREVLQELK